MLAHRIGTFFIMLGIGLIILFVLSNMADTPVCNLFIVGVIVLGLGIFLWFRNPLPKATGGSRFRLFKGARKKQDES